MRCRQILLALALAGCSSATAPMGVRGPDGEILTTVVSRTTVTLGDTLTVWLTVRNPFPRADTTYLITVCVPITQMVSASGDTLPGAQYPSCDLTDQPVSMPANTTVTLPPGVNRLSNGFRPPQPLGFYMVVPGHYTIAACTQRVPSWNTVGVTQVVCGQPIGIEVTA